ncbi:MAG: hypothetical protein ACKN9V_01275 [Pseudomonadota bacterium]
MRKKQKAYPRIKMLCKSVKAIPFSHPDLNKWRSNASGVRFQHEKTGFLITGAVDDWFSLPNGEAVIISPRRLSSSAIGLMASDISRSALKMDVAYFLY